MGILSICPHWTWAKWARVYNLPTLSRIVRLYDESHVYQFA